MSLFKRFKKPKPTKSDLEAFKTQLKYGSDPKELYESARAHFDAYRKEDEEVKHILARVLDAPECDEWKKWSKIQVADYDDACTESPVGKHVYMHTYGDQHPDYSKDTHCLCCDKLIYKGKD